MHEVKNNSWLKAKGEMYFRKGTKPRWIEVEMRQKDGSIVRLIAREVIEFYSEREMQL